MSLCGIFGILGIHHFYLGNALHGLFDLGLFLAAIAILLSPGLQSDGWITVAILLLAADLLHTMFVFYRLITGAERDGKGRPVPVPGNRR